MKIAFYKSPVGILKICEKQRYLISGAKTVRSGTSQNSPLLTRTMKQLDEYFLGKRQQFDLHLSPVGTAFQKKVWRALRDIPYGKLRTYQDIAEIIGHPRAFRAVGNANGRNRLPIIIPCHRVVGKHPQSGGFGMGMKAKEILIGLENIDSYFNI